ncbi:MAG TPA: hypothetical protein VIL46_00565, partial [Gemmataceae bacterium]
MPPTCDYCRGPLHGTGHAGRPWPGHAAARYCCFGCLALGEQERQEALTPAGRPAVRVTGPVVRLGIALLIAGQSMIFSLAVNITPPPEPTRTVLQGAILASTLAVVALLGGPLFRAAWRELRAGRVTIEALFVLTMAGALGASMQSFLTGRGHIYFEVVSILLAVYTLGKMIGARSRAAAVASTQSWASSLSTCRVVDAKGRTRAVGVAEVLPGDVVEVYPGETVPVDGVIREGVGFVSEAPVSGEPFAVVRRPGDRVLAGTASY